MTTKIKRFSSDPYGMDAEKERDVCAQFDTWYDTQMPIPNVLSMRLARSAFRFYLDVIYRSSQETPT